MKQSAPALGRLSDRVGVARLRPRQAERPQLLHIEFKNFLRRSRLRGLDPRPNGVARGDRELLLHKDSQKRRETAGAAAERRRAGQRDDVGETRLHRDQMGDALGQIRLALDHPHLAPKPCRAHPCHMAARLRARPAALASRP